MKQIDGRVAFITGGASGIGLGMAKAFTRAGMKAVIADIRDDHLAEARAWFDAAGRAGSVHFIKLDVTDRQAYEAAAVEAERVFGPIHVLCNNAGIGISTPIGRASYEDWDWGGRHQCERRLRGRPHLPAAHARPWPGRSYRQHRLDGRYPPI